MTTFEKARAAFERAVKSQLSSFYRDLYTAQGFATTEIPKNATEWSHIPLLSKTDLLSTPFLERLFVPIEDVEEIRFTSGTSGKGVLVMPRSVWHISSPGDPLFPGKVVMSLYFRTFIFIRARGENRQTILAGDPSEFPASAALAAKAGVDALNGPASMLIAFAEHLEPYGMRSHIRFLNLTAERMSRLQQQVLQECYPNAGITNLYALHETGQIGYSPLGTDPSLLTIFPDQFAEVIDGDSVRHVEDIRAPVDGELVVTGVDELAFPVIRYRTGDRVRVHPQKGNSPLIEVLGRAEEERVRIPGGQIVLSELERAIAKTMGASIADYTCAVSEKKNRSRIVTVLALTLYTKTAYGSDAKNVASNIAKNLRVNRDRTYHDGIVRGLYEPLICDIVPLQLTNEKRKHLVDERT